MTESENTNSIANKEVEHKKFKLKLKCMSPFTEQFSRKGVKYWRMTVRLVTRKTSINRQPMFLCTRNQQISRKIKMWDTINVVTTYDPRTKTERELDDGNWEYLWGWENTLEILDRPNVDVEEI